MDHNNQKVGFIARGTKLGCLNLQKESYFSFKRKRGTLIKYRQATLTEEEHWDSSRAPFS